MGYPSEVKSLVVSRVLSGEICCSCEHHWLRTETRSEIGAFTKIRMSNILVFTKLGTRVHDLRKSQPDITCWLDG